MIVLVTGGAGFIGSHLVEAILKGGWKVRILDNLSTGKVENLVEATGNPLAQSMDQGKSAKYYTLGKEAEFVEGDISDIETCRKACEGVTHIFHLAALVSVQRSVENAVVSHRANATGTLNMLQAAREAGVKRFIFASSSSVYGNVSSENGEVVAKQETFQPHPESPYALTKLCGEIYGQIFAQIYGLETVCLRFFNVFGPRQNPQSVYAAVVPRFITALLDGRQPVIYGDGGQSRDFTYMENVVQANLLAMEAPGISGKVFNIACGQATTVNDLWNMLAGIAGRKITPRYETARRGEVRHSLSAIRLAKENLGYEPKIGLRDGLVATWRWFEKNARKRGVSP